MSLLSWCLLFSCISVGFLRGIPALPFWTAACVGSSFYPLITLIVSLTKTCTYYRCTRVHTRGKRTLSWCNSRFLFVLCYQLKRFSKEFKRWSSFCLYILPVLAWFTSCTNVSLKFMSPLTSVLAHTCTGNQAQLLHWSQHRRDK